MTDGPLRSYPFQVTGAPTLRTIADRYGLDRINVKEFGATGDGVTDDSGAIQAAIEYCMHFYSYPFYGGAIVSLPPGIYYCAKPIILGISPNWGGGTGTFQLVGASRSASVIKGNWNGGTVGGISYNPFLVQKDPRDGNYDACSVVSNLTIQNDNQAVGAGGILLINEMVATMLDSLIVVGNRAIVMGDTFGGLVVNCDLRCSTPINSADSGGVAAGSVGIYTFQTQVVSCIATGFDIGYALGGPGDLLIANRVSRCNIGVYGGVVSPYSSGANINTASCILANQVDRCTKGMWFYETSYATTAGNIVSGNTGAADPAAVQGMSWNSGSHVVTVTTPGPHNLPIVNDVKSLATSGTPSGGSFTLDFAGSTTAPIAFNASASAVQSALVALSSIGSGNVNCTGGPLPATVMITFVSALGCANQPDFTFPTNSLTGGSSPAPYSYHMVAGNPSVWLDLIVAPPNWTPDGSGHQLVFAKRPDGSTASSITFTYPGPTSSPGGFTSGTWNYSLQYAMQMRSFSENFMAANSLSAIVSVASFDMTNANNQGVHFNNYVASTQGPYGWIPPQNGLGCGAGWQFEKCGMAGKNPPVAYMEYRDLPGQFGVYQNLGTGLEFTIINADTQSFGGTVTATGGSNHYKARYNSINWTRTG